jgi:class 3 adenylate cyclase/WD40 repeat protein/tRNA A-37 threonylcarbamoyl transferase component Bud32/energy-coupling factor transporter ATP-binding protein EcfA2
MHGGIGQRRRPPSEVLKGRYELLEVLGSGGEARVVKALDRQHMRLVALKLRPVGSELGRDDLLREARVLLGVTPHPSLPLVREDFFDGAQYVVVMDWVDGTDLARLLGDKGTPGLPLSSVLAYVAEAAEALTFLYGHDPPIVHGDVKPANLILTRGGHVKLVDFGLSSTLGMEGQRRGSAGYRAPELEAGGPPSRASDVYALTATAFALLTGAPPAGETSTWERLDAGLTAGLDAGLAAVQVSRLEAAFTAGLAADPALRPGSPGELVERLRAGWVSTLPTGVVTVCLSDIEGSTRLWENRPAEMAESLVRHDDLIARAVEAHDGRFVKSMGEGDSTASVFESAAQAVRAAIEATRALAQEPWPDGAPIRVRFGLHTGEVQRRDGIYLGTTVNLAARVRGAAGGGEILLSEATAAVAGGDLPDGYAIVDLGHHKLKGIRSPQSLKALTGPGLATETAAADCPYRGLLAFQPRDRHLFFGREEVIGEVLARMAPGRLLAVVGASGSGKSSLLRAGVIAAVTAGEHPAADGARLITPGAEPPLELDDDAHELLVVDQFEEIYTQCHDLELRARFIAAVLSRRGPVVIGVRADFYGEMSTDAELAGAVAHNQVLLGPMRDDDLRRAIAEPARLAGLRLEPGLIDLVLRDVAGEPGALPLMSHALRETWERRDGRTLTVEAYHHSGGVSSAVAQTADALVEDTPEPDRALLRGVFLRLTELGDDVEDTRRRVRIEELVPEGTSEEAVKVLLERLAEARLVTLDQGTAEVAHEVLIRRWPTLRRWLEEDREGIRLHRRLSDAAQLWEAAGREPADLYRGTRLDAAVEWASANSAPLNRTERDFLNASVDESARTQRRQLKANRRLRRALSAGAALLVAALALLVFALTSRQAAVRAEGSARSQALATEAQTQIARDPQLALLLSRAALHDAPTPQAELAASEALDANTALSQLPGFGAQGCLTANFLFLFDRGRLAADNTCDGHVVFADLPNQRIISRVRVGSSSTDMVLGPTGRALIVATGRSLVSVDLRSGRVRHLFTAPFPIDQVASGPGGAYLAIADNDTIAVVDLHHGRLRVIAHGDASVNVVNGMMPASPHEVLVASTGQSRGHGNLLPGVTALDVVTGAQRTVTLARSRQLAAVNFLRVSPDERTWYVTGSEIGANNDKQVSATWAVDARTGRVRWVATGPAGAIASPIQTSPDGRLVAVGYSSGAADVLDAGTGRLVVRDTSSSSIAAGDLAIPPGDNMLVTVSLDGVFRTWAVRGSEQLRLQAPADPALDFTADGRDLVLVGARGEVVNERTGRLVRTFPGFPAASVFNTCNSACFSASRGIRWLSYLDPSSASPRIIELDGRTGRRVAAATVPRLDAQGVAPDGRIVVAYVDGGRMFARVIEPRSGVVRALAPGASSAGCAATTPSFTPDSRLLAVADGCLNVVVWNLRSGRVARTIVLPDRASGSGALLSPDGRYVLVAVLGGAFVRVDLATGKAVEIPGAQTEGNVIAVSPDGRFYAIGRQDGTVDEYNARSLALVREHTVGNAVQTLAFSPSSGALAVEDTGHVVWVWDTCAVCENPTRLSELAARNSVRGLTPGERATFNVH